MSRSSSRTCCRSPSPPPGSGSGSAAGSSKSGRCKVHVTLSAAVTVLALAIGTQLLCLHAGRVTAAAASDPGVVVTSVGPVLWQDRILNAGETMANINSNDSVFVMQNDCNLVVYPEGPGAYAAWSSQTDNRASGCHLKMQSDGNLVIYDSSGAAVWASQTAGRFEGPYYFIYQTDNNAVIYGKDKQALWSTNTGGYI